MKIISNIDKNHYDLIRKNVSDFILNLSNLYDSKDFIILDVAPEKHLGAKEHFKLATIKTLDIDPNSDADYIADLCNTNTEIIPNDTFDLIICSEVLEHTNNPFYAVNELRRILKPKGLVCVSTPFNFRIHGPLPDNWRFTIHGLKVLFSNFEDVKINELNDDDRFLMPIHYTLIAKK
jgi:ubiquinone/menaquinone biosynthesis C-methylase UbiE